MKTMKKWMSMLLCAAMLLSFSACGAASDEAGMMADGGAVYKGDGGSSAPNYVTTTAATYMVSAMEAAADMIMSEATMAATTTAPVSSTVQIPPEEYGKLIENPFISTAENKVSTFSADVDTASYTYFRKLMGYGWSLSEIIAQAGSSIRTEEMINYFDYDYVEPGEGQLFGVKTQIAPCPWNEDAVLMQLGLKADEMISTKGNNLVFLIDVSGSMRSDDKLPLLQTAFTYLTETLSSDDIVSIVTYSGREAVLLEGCKGTYTDQILKAVNSLDANGSTNGQAGLQKAYEIAAKYLIEGGNNRIILASDGDLNVGIRNPDELKAFVEEKRDAGIYLTTLGFGTGNYRDANMEALADNGNGVYHYIDCAAEAEKIFGDDLLSTLYTVAEDVKMQITFDPQYVREYRLVGYENRLLNEEDFEDDTKDAGEVGAGHTLTVCYELVLTENAATPTAEMELMKLAIRHKAPGEDVSQLNEYPVTGASYTATPDNDFKFICAVAELSMILHASEYTSPENLAAIRDELAALPLGDDMYKEAFRDMVAKLVK